MSIKVMSWIWEHSKRKSSALLTLLALADFCNDDGECFPGTNRLAKKARISTPTLHNVLFILEHEQDIGIENGKGVYANGGTTNRYYVNGYRLSVGLPAVITGTHSPNVQSLARKQTRFVRLDTPVKTGEQGINPSLQPPVNPSLQPPVKPGLQKPSVKPSVKPKKPASAAQDALPKKITTPASLMNPLKDAIVLAMGWSWDTMTRTEKGTVQTAAKSFAEANATPDEVARCKKECDRREWKNYGAVALTKVLSDLRKAAVPASSNGNGKRKAYYRNAWVEASRLSPDGTLDGTQRPGWLLAEIPAAGEFGGVALKQGEKVYHDGTLPLAWQGLE